MTMQYFSTDASQISFQQPVTGAAVRSIFAKLSDVASRRSVLDFNGVDPTGVADSSSGINNALAGGGIIVVPPGTYSIQADLLFTSNTLFYVMRGATMNFNATRFTPTAATVVNVALVVDGAMVSSNLSTNAPQKFSWPSDTGGSGPTTTFERGFIEFGGASSAARSTGFFYVGGHGTISGDFVGTPSIANLWTGDICRKGIATFYCDNVLVEDLNIYGFHGEAVYHWDNAPSNVVSNVVFQNLYVHDTNFNALNFNHLSESRGCYIRANTTYNSYQGIELSAGHALNNTVRLTQGPGVLIGGGVVQTVSIRGNVIEGAQMDGISAIAMSGNTGTGIVDVADNYIYSTQANAINAANLAHFTAENNVIEIYATTSSSYGIYVGSGVTFGSVVGNRLVAPNAGLILPIRNTATSAVTFDNWYYDTSTNAPILARTTSPFGVSSQTVEYRVTDSPSAAGAGHTTNYRINAGASTTAQASYAKMYSSIDATGATGASGSLHFATKKTSTESTTLSDTMVFDQNGNALVVSAGGLGYGAGSGGTVTQSTSKSTAVTLNSPTGQITMNNAALAGNTTIGFTLNNSTMGPNDVLVASINANSPNAALYFVKGIASTAATILVTNTSGGSLSDAVIINFAVIKGSST